MTRLKASSVQAVEGGREEQFVNKIPEKPFFLCKSQQHGRTDVREAFLKKPAELVALLGNIL